jgi:tetratricopeptide (TPR) repeat protein
MNAKTRIASALLVAAAAGTLAACSTPEAKVEGFNKRGEALLQKGDLVKARLEFQNALQINPSAAPALYGLAVVAERSRDWKAAYHLLGRVVELQPTHLDALVKLGKLQLASGQLDKALQSAEAAQAIRATSPDVLALRSAVFLKLNEPAKSVALAREALAAAPAHIDALVVLATERLQAGDADAAVGFLDQGLQGNERNVSLQILKVQALEKVARTDRAEEVLRKLVSLFPDKTEYRQLLAAFYATHKQHAKAEAEYRALVAASPKLTEPKLQLVRFLEGTGGAAAAGAELERLVRAEPQAHELKLALASLRLQQKNDAAAIALWKDLIASEGAGAIRARGALASYQLARDDTAGAKGLIEQMVKKDPRDEQALLLRAGIALDERKLDDAVADLRTVLRDAPESGAAHLLLARAYEMQGSQELASQQYANAAQAARFAPGVALPYAERLLRSGQPRQAQEVLREVLRASPGHLAAMRMLADTHLRSGDTAAAQALADELARTQGREVAASQLQGAVQLARKDFGNGIASFRRAYELAPGDPQAMTSTVRSYLLAGKPKEALAFLQTVLGASPQNQLARVLLSQVQAQTGNLPGAAESLQAAIQVDPAAPVPHQVLVGLHLAGRKLPEALAAADRGLQAAPNDFGLRLARAGVLEAQGRTDEAITAYESLLAERPNASIVANNLASLLTETRKDAASVRRAFEIAQRFRGTDIPQMKDTLGWATHLAGRHREAADLLKSALAQAPNLAVVHYHYGMNQLALNNVQNAKEALRRAVELARTSPFAQAEEARQTLQNL